MKNKNSHKKINIIFPGQGSQYVGMGEKFKNHSSFKRLDQANSALDFDLKTIMLKDPENKLNQTAYTQPAILCYSVMLFDFLKEKYQLKTQDMGIVLGHSVGEYAALVAAEVLSFEQALLLVNKRGLYMQEACPMGLGTMVALMKVPREIVETLCSEISTNNCFVEPANFNSPDQIVVSGHVKACEKLIENLKENFKAPYRAIKLSVSAPFHCSLMKKAALQLKKELDRLTFKKNTIAYIPNATATILNKGTSTELIKNLLVEQVYKSVLWTDSFNLLEHDGVFFEAGPKKVLQGLAKKINSQINVIALDDEINILKQGKIGDLICPTPLVI